MPTHVACVGDSITQGVGASSAATNYVSLLQGLMGSGVNVKNFGLSGATMLSAGFGDHPYQTTPSYQAATEFVANAGEGSVVSVVILLGANDSKPYNWSPNAKPKNDQQYLLDYRAMVDHFLALPTKPVVYLGLPVAAGPAACCDISGAVILDEQIPLIRQLAMEKHLPIIDLNTPTTGHPEYFIDDVHPNDAGYEVLAEAVHEGLLRVPTVSLTSPLPTALLETGVAVSLIAQASGETVQISSVEFFQGAVSLGTARAAPFSLDWLAAAGSYVVTAKAIDSTLASTVSEPVTLTVTQSGAGGSDAAAGGNEAGVNGGVAADGDSGCACSIPAGTGVPGWTWPLLCLVVLGVRRRRADASSRVA